MLGYGETEKPQETERYTGDKILGDMVALLDTLAIPKMDIVGHDWGGYASWELAIRYPERFRRHFVVSQGNPDRMFTPGSSEDVTANWYMYLKTQQDADELSAANDGEFFRKFFLPTHPDLMDVWTRMTYPRGPHAMLNGNRY